MWIEYEDESTQTYYWRISPDETNMYSFYSSDWDELGYLKLTIFDKDNNIVQTSNNGSWCLKDGQEYVLRFSYRYNEYCYNDVKFWLEADRKHVHTYSNDADTSCNGCGRFAYPGGNVLYKENGKYYDRKDCRFVLNIYEWLKCQTEIKD